MSSLIKAAEESSAQSFSETRKAFSATGEPLYGFYELAVKMTAIPETHPRVIDRPEPYGRNVQAFVEEVESFSSQSAGFAAIIDQSKCPKWSECFAELTALMGDAENWAGRLVRSKVQRVWKERKKQTEKVRPRWRRSRKVSARASWQGAWLALGARNW